MEKLYRDIVTFIGGMDSILQIAIIALLAVLVCFNVIAIFKTHINAKKPVLKVGQFLLLAILLAILIFFCIHSF